MPSALPEGQLLRTLVASKPGGNILELGTGMGLSLAWMVDGLRGGASILSLDNDTQLVDIVSAEIQNPDVTILTVDGDAWIQQYDGPKFDLIFADTWPGKYRFLEETIDLLAPGGLYVADDMNEQANWPEGHAEKAAKLIETLIDHPKLDCTYLDWSTGVILGTRL
ncbi:O-methyltransferase [Lewinella sp. 4G2]|uniref:O-methyltransferase n=1 Tax=Lewinella sp. 4G2 TaxID=1803372 RepID=UPI0009EDF979|nr:class I SAM-dependent methyltransferase [Lewinella sp. 4G2]